MNVFENIRWVVVDIYQSLARIAVPVFIMLTGALLLQPAKKESIGVFFKKRWSRIGFPFIFWGAIYFAWDFLVVRVPFSAGAIIQGILNGPYSQFWYLYVLFGLYLLTPVLRIFMANADPAVIKYFLVVSLTGLAVMPIFGSLIPYTLNVNVFTVTGFVGYFVLGAYLLTVQVRRSTITIFMILGIALTTIGTYILAATVGGTQMYYFQQYFSPTIILSSVMVFLLLLKIKPPPVEQGTARLSIGSKLVKTISQNSLCLFLFHVIVLQSIENGYFGFAINRLTLNPIIEVPLMTTIVLFISLAVIILLKKIPHFEKVIG